VTFLDVLGGLLFDVFSNTPSAISAGFLATTAVCATTPKLLRPALNFVISTNNALWFDDLMEDLGNKVSLFFQPENADAGSMAKAVAVAVSAACSL